MGFERSEIVVVRNTERVNSGVQSPSIPGLARERVKSTVTFVPLSSPISLQGLKHTLFTISAELEKEKGMVYASTRIPVQSRATQSEKWARYPLMSLNHKLIQGTAILNRTCSFMNRVKLSQREKD